MTNEQLKALLETYRALLRTEIENLHRELESCSDAHEREKLFLSCPVEENPTGPFKALDGLRLLSRLMSRATEDLSSKKARKL